ncbi:MAG: molybdopterin-dependent oxidoreductase [Chromatiales bacterium]|jgi:thiosulfate reductase/polysulfide reductase chain A
MKRRSFIKLSGLFGAGVAAPSIFLSGCAQKPLPGSGQVRVTPTVCDICFWKCAGLVHTEDGQPWKITGNPDDTHSEGRLCTRGSAGIGAYQDRDRLKQPLLRVGKEQGEQQFKPVSWDEAFDFITKRMQGIAEQHGKDRIALLSHGSGGHHFERLLQAFGSHIYAHPSYAQCRGPREVGFTLTFGESVGSPDRTDMANSRCIVLIGSHIGENLHNSQVQSLSQALDNNATLITVDPRFSVAAGKSRLWLPIRPGTDIALLLAWMNVIINEQLYDQDYVAQYTSGIEQLQQHVQPFNPEWAYLETGLEPELIRETARTMAMHAPATLVHPGRHTTWYGDDTQRSRAIAMLNALLGSWGRPGGFFMPEAVELPDYPAPQPPEASEDWKSKIQSAYPLAPSGISQAIIDACSGDDAYVKGLFVYSSNLPMTIPNIGAKLQAAADSLDLIVVIDTLPAEVTGYADVILPECTYLERYDDLRNAPEKIPSLALRTPVFEPRHQSKPGWWMAKQLAEKLGLGEYFPWQDYSKVLDWQLQQVGSSLEEMQRIGVKQFQRKTPLYFRYGEARRFNTGSGKIEFYSQLLADYGFDPMPVYTPPEQSPEGFYRLIYGRAPAHTFGRTTNNPLLFELMPENSVWINPITASRHRIGNGDYVKLKNQHGVTSNKVRVRVTERIGPNAVFMAHGFGHTAKGLRLTSGVGADDAALITNVKIDPIAGSTGMRSNFVTFLEA